MKLIPEPPSPNPNAYANQKLARDRAEILHDEEWQLHNECITLAREALDLYKAQGEKRLRIPDLIRLLDLASRLGRLATGIPTEHFHHDWQQYENPPGSDQFEADLKRIYGNSEDQSRSADFQSAVSQASSLPHSAITASAAEIQNTRDNPTQDMEA